MAEDTRFGARVGEGGGGSSPLPSPAQRGVCVADEEGAPSGGETGGEASGILSNVWSGFKYWAGFGWVGSLMGVGKKRRGSSAASRPYDDFSDPGGGGGAWGWGWGLTHRRTPHACAKLASPRLCLASLTRVWLRVGSCAEAEALRNKYREASDAVSSVETQVKSVDESMSRDYGPGSVFEPLSHECVMFTPGGEFSYELCPYGDAKQKDKNGGSTTIGKWQGFGEGAHTEMLFDNGQHCWNAGARTLRVSLTCATEHKILGVEEPEVCKYTMRLETPAACTDEHLAEAQRDAAALAPDAVHDEL